MGDVLSTDARPAQTGSFTLHLKKYNVTEKQAEICNLFPTSELSRILKHDKVRYQGHSLNEYLMKGENINSNLFEVALRFREKEVGVIANISKLF